MNLRILLLNLHVFTTWKKINEDNRKKIIDENVYGYKVGDYVIYTTGIYGDTPLEIVEIRPGKYSVIVNAMIFGNMTRVEMGIGEIEVCKDKAWLVVVEE